MNIDDKSLFALREVVSQHSAGEVSMFVTFWCPFSSRCCVPKIILKLVDFQGVIQIIIIIIIMRTVSRQTVVQFTPLSL